MGFFLNYTIATPLALFYTIYLITGKKARQISENIDYSFLQWPVFGMAQVLPGIMAYFILA